MLLQWLNRRRVNEVGNRSLLRADQRAIGTLGSDFVEQLANRADEYANQGDYARAIEVYQELISRDRHQPRALHDLGIALCHLGRFKEAEGWLLRAIEAQPDFPAAHNNLGLILRFLGRHVQSEASIRRAIEYEPANTSFRGNLGQTLLLLGRTREAEECFSMVLRATPSDLEAAVGLGDVARLEGRFEGAEKIFKEILEKQPRMPRVWALLASLRRMTVADGVWLKGARELADSEIAPIEEAALRFALGKYWDDVGEYTRAFESYKRANELLKTTVTKYNREARAAYVNDMVRVYTREALAQVKGGASASTTPVFIVGMPRSGTSLVEQILASHRAASGAGELGFWTEALFANAAAVRQALLPEPARKELAKAYLRILTDYGGDAQRIVDKAPVNSEYLGLIHSVFPNARILYMQRNPIDTCLSCYFQQLSTALSYTMDLSDLAHYYRTHHRLMAHWRKVLPSDTLLDVPYEELIADQEGWTRRILDFVGLDWDARCLEFQNTKRAVTTASSWQVRQKIYAGSVERWRNYEQFVGPLSELRELYPPFGDGEAHPFLN